MRILLVNNVCGLGGVEVHMAGLASGLVRSGHRVEAYFYDGGNGHSLFDDVCRITVGPYPSLGEILTKTDFDLVHATTATIPCGLFATMDRVGYGGAVVVTCHAGVVRGHVSNRKNVAFTAVSSQAKNDLRDVLGVEACVLPNGVDCQTFSPDGDADSVESPVLLWVGRSYHEEKDFVGFCAVASVLVQKGWNAWVVDASPDTHNNTLCSWLGTRCRVMKGLGQSDLARLYRSVARSGGCLLSTSVSETFGLVIAEAMACGCPVVAPRVGGIPDIVSDGVTGLTYERSGGVEAVLQRIEAIRDRPTRIALAENAACEIRRRFDINRMVADYCALYAQVASPERGATFSCRRYASSVYFAARRAFHSARYRATAR